jgi:kynurenine formamidase
LTKRWTRRPEGSNWGDFGADDQLGSLNHITEREVREAVGTVSEGHRFCLSLPLDYPGGNGLAPHRLPPVLHATTRHGKPYFNYAFADEASGCCDGGCDDQVTLSTQYSTQWDSLAHIGYHFDLFGTGEPVLCYYNGYAAVRDLLPPGERDPDAYVPLGIDAFAARPIQGRGVLIDIEKHFGRSKRDITFADIEAILEQDRLEVRRGDILCLHTGFADEVLTMNKHPDVERLHNMFAALDGRDSDLLAWITETGISAIAADNYAVERVGLPPKGPEPAFVPLHHHCLFKRGIPLGELWHLTELAAWLRANERYTFLLTAPPLRLPGAMGSPVTPVATV